MAQHTCGGLPQDTVEIDECHPVEAPQVATAPLTAEPSVSRPNSRGSPPKLARVTSGGDELVAKRPALMPTNRHDAGTGKGADVVRVFAVGVVRIGLGVGIAGATLTLLGLITQRADVFSTAIAIVLLGFWIAARLRPDRAHRLLLRPAVIVLAAAAPAGVAAIGGALASPFVAQSFCVIGIAALITRVTTLVACVLASTTVYVIACLVHPGDVSDAMHGYELTIAMNNLIDCAAIGALLLAMAVSFRGVVIGAPLLLADIRGGGDAPTPMLTRAVQLAGSARPAALCRADPRALSDLLSVAEQRVVGLLADGLTPQQIAQSLGRSVATIRSQLASAKRKTGARTLEQLVDIVVSAAQARHDD